MEEILKKAIGKDCKDCNGEGVLLTYNSLRDSLEIQRCDTCKKFKSDIKAWESVKPKE